uniref:Uncharacterized protein n=1 Tax=Ditylenchus dipsaci TaxID=166011 RepID=A0A915CXR9_9BILA
MSLTFVCRLCIAIGLLLIISSEAVENVEVKAKPAVANPVAVVAVSLAAVVAASHVAAAANVVAANVHAAANRVVLAVNCFKTLKSLETYPISGSGYGRRRRHHCCTNGAVQQAIVPPNTYSNSPAAFPITILPTAVSESPADKQCECSAFNLPASGSGSLPPMPSPQPIPAQSAEPAKEPEPKGGCDCGCCDCGCCDCGCCGCMAARKTAPVAAASPSVTGTIKSCGCESPEPSADDPRADGEAAKDVDAVQKHKVFRRLRSKPQGKLHSLIKRTQSTGKYSQSLLHHKPIVRHKIIV